MLKSYWTLFKAIIDNKVAFYWGFFVQKQPIKVVFSNNCRETEGRVWGTLHEWLEMRWKVSFGHNPFDYNSVGLATKGLSGYSSILLCVGGTMPMALRTEYILSVFGEHFYQISVCYCISLSLRVSLRRLRPSRRLQKRMVFVRILRFSIFCQVWWLICPSGLWFAQVAQDADTTPFRWFFVLFIGSFSSLTILHFSFASYYL